MKTVFGMNTAAHLRPASERVASAGIRKDRQQLSDLISLVYDAAVDQSLWENAIERSHISWAASELGSSARA